LIERVSICQANFHSRRLARDNKLSRPLLLERRGGRALEGKADRKRKEEGAIS
jgi:hypothetical protein